MLLLYSRARPKRREKAADVLVDDQVCMLVDRRLYQQQRILVGRSLVQERGNGYGVPTAGQSPRGEKRL